MKKTNLSFFIFFLFGFYINLEGQDTITLKNPSFEDMPRKGGEQNSKPIFEWQDCGLIDFPGESPPDIHPVRGDAWGVIKEAYDGKTYLGLVTRYSETFESISQQLSKTIEAGKCYSIDVFLSLSVTYSSPTQRSRLIARNTYLIRVPPENFAHPVELFIWGGDASCRRRKLLAHSGPIANDDWRLFTLKFFPKETYQYITIGAFYEYGHKEPYNGHVLVDGLSPIIEIECDK